MQGYMVNLPLENSLFNVKNNAAKHLQLIRSIPAESLKCTLVGMKSQANIKTNLELGGQFFLLLPNKRLVETVFLCGRNKLEINHAIMVRRSPKVDISRVMMRGKHQDNISDDYIKTEVVVYNENKEYTPEFVALLKDYYLNF